MWNFFYNDRVGADLGPFADSEWAENFGARTDYDIVTDGRMTFDLIPGDAAKSNAMINFAKIKGLKVDVDEHGEVSVIGKFKGGDLIETTRATGESHPQKKVSDKTRNITEGTTTDRDPKEPRDS